VTEGTTEKSAGIDRAEYHSALANGLVIGRYKILAVLGEGGFGITYRCHDTQLHRDVAIKEYLPSGLAIRQCCRDRPKCRRISSGAAAASSTRRGPWRS